MGHAARAAAAQHDGHGGPVTGLADGVHLRPDADDREGIALRVDTGSEETGLRRPDDGAQACADKEKDAFQKFLHSRVLSFSPSGK